MTYTPRPYKRSDVARYLTECHVVFDDDDIDDCLSEIELLLLTSFKNDYNGALHRACGEFTKRWHLEHGHEYRPVVYSPARWPKEFIQGLTTLQRHILESRIIGEPVRATAARLHKTPNNLCASWQRVLILYEQWVDTGDLHLKRGWPLGRKRGPWPLGRKPGIRPGHTVAELIERKRLRLLA
jgi:hypothetical protein